MGIANVLTLQGVPAAPPNIERNQKAASLGSASSPTRSDGHSREYLNGNDAPEHLASARRQMNLDTHAPSISSSKRRQNYSDDSPHEEDSTVASHHKLKKASTISIGKLPCIYHAGDPDRWSTDRCRKKHKNMSELR